MLLSRSERRRLSATARAFMIHTHSGGALARSCVLHRHVFLHLREHGRSLIVLQVHSSDFFRYGLTEVYSTAPSLAQLKGRQYQSLGQAAREIHVHIHGKDRGYVNYSLEYEAYCMGLSEEACATQLGTATRRVVSHGEEFEVPFSPELLTTFCVTEPDSLAPGGRWVACCHLLPMVPLGVDDSVAEARLAQLMSEDRHHATVGSRQRRSLMASGGGGSTSTQHSHARGGEQQQHARRGEQQHAHVGELQLQ
jgi:hypothetical protein